MYLEFLDRALSAEPSLFRQMLLTFEELIGDRLAGAHVLDVACGEGYLSRFLAERGASEAVGIDLSSALIDVARERTSLSNVSFCVDDAQKLESIPDASMDVAVSQMALMDIPDHAATFRAVRRALEPGGVFVFSLLHPCFEAPFYGNEEPLLVDEAEQPAARVIRHYAVEGHWKPASERGVRGHVGSYHRTLSTYLNDLVRSGFRFEELREPVFDAPGVFSEVPRVMLVSARAG